MKACTFFDNLYLHVLLMTATLLIYGLVDYNDYNIISLAIILCRISYVFATLIPGFVDAEL